MTYRVVAKGDWYEVRAQQGDDQVYELLIYGDIGDSWNDSSITAAELVRDLQTVEASRLVVRVNSDGGSVSDGLAIYNALRRHPAAVDVKVDGVAISIASLIAMAGDTVEIAENGMFMVHAPWGGTYGNAADMREYADMLDKYAAAMATSYVRKTGKSTDEVVALLTDGKDHWFTAAEAVAWGLADNTFEAIEVNASLNLNRYRNIPAAAAAFTRKEQPRMTVQTEPAATPQAAAQPPAAIAQPQPTTTPTAPFARDKAANERVLASFKPFAAKPEVLALQTEILADPAITEVQASDRLLKLLGAEAEPAQPKGAGVRVQTVEDETDKFRAAAAESVLARAAIQGVNVDRAVLAANPYRGAKLLDLARASLDRAGVNTRGMDQMQVVAAAFTQSTSDFTVLLENVMHKALLGAYAITPDTWSRFCAVGSVSDFRAHNRYRLGSFGNLDSLNELGEFKNKSIPDGEKASVSIGTKGNIINLSRQMIVNDDLGAFVGVAAMLGRAARRTIEADVYALLALNGGLGPAMDDGKTLFHADHGNIASAAAPTVVAFDAARVLMTQQKDISGNDFLDLRPDVWLGPVGLGGVVRVLNEAQYDPDTANKLQSPNRVRGLVRDIVDSPRLSGTRWYMLADKNVAPTIEVDFLDGNQEPYLEQQQGFTVDGTQFKVRADYGVTAIDYRGSVTNAGA